MRRPNLYSRGIGYVLFIAGSSLSVWLGTAVWQGFETHNWQPADGVIYQSRMLEETRRGNEVLYTHELSYRYRLPTGTFTGENVYRTDLPLASEAQVSDLTNRFPVGALQTVYVNPNDPAEAVLVKGISVQLLMAFVFALACLGVGLISFRGRS